ncbi:MAG: LacI family DNA-binding transcriptional regulator [Bacillota bacterium]|nr:LacI family DNA-binding transcriptional regulator [Bacillota bacterium]
MTIKDIAQLAGVSPATVSNVMNKTGRVSKETVSRVIEIVNEKNFNLNASARTLRQKVSRLIAILVPDYSESENTYHGQELGIANPFYLEFVSKTEEILSKHGFETIFKVVSVKSDLKFIKERNLDGVIVIGAHEGSEFTSKVVSYNVPVVFVDSYLSNGEVSLINTDDQLGGYLSTRHLLGLGHQKILFISGELQSSGVNYERSLGYQRALEEHGVKIEPSFIIQTDVTVEEGRALAHRLAFKNNEFTGIVTTADALAIGLIRGFYECGISVPGQVSIVGFDDISVSAFIIPSITTVHQDFELKAKRAAILLTKLIHGSDSEKIQQDNLLPKLIVRESTAEPFSK